ncbi:Alpha-(1,3)-fucosyltransferase C, partial [Armadillidium vulgare]
VDIYGRCGPLNCSHSEDCYETFEKEYKFYFSFENSICHDYITEKLFNVLGWKEDYISTEDNVFKAMNLCMLCDKLHTKIEAKIYPDMEDWYLKKSNCLFCGKMPLKKRITTKCFNTLQEYLKDII